MRNPCVDNDDWYKAEQLHFAATEGDIERCRQLIAEGYDVNSYDQIGHTPLHYAAAGEHFKLVKFLLQHGARVNAVCEPMIGETVLAHIAETCTLQMAELLLNAGADPTLRVGLRRNAIEAAQNRKRGEGPLVYRLLRQHAAYDAE